MSRRAAAFASCAALLIFVAGRCLVPMDETDLFFNLRLGELVLSQHHVPRTNLLSFTYPDFRDVNLAWIFQIVLALAHRAGGIPGTVVLKTAFVLTTFALLFRVALRRGAHPAAAGAGCAPRRRDTRKSTANVPTTNAVLRRTVPGTPATP